MTLPHQVLSEAIDGLEAALVKSDAKTGDQLEDSYPYRLGWLQGSIKHALRRLPFAQSELELERELERAEADA